MITQSNIKKAFFLFLFCLFLQVTFIKSQIYVGVKSGIGASKYIFQQPVKQDFSIVYKQGFVLNYLNKRNMGIHIEFDYSQKSWNEISDISNPQKMDLQYFEIPMLTYIKFGKKKSGITLSAGPYISFLNNYKYTANAPLDTANIFFYVYIDYNSTNLIHSKFDYGLSAALGYELATAFGNFQISFMYSQGFNDLLKKNPDSILLSINQNLFAEFTYKLQLFGKKNKKIKIITKKNKEIKKGKLLDAKKLIKEDMNIK